MSISRIKQRNAFRSLYPNVVDFTQMSDKEIDYFLNHPVYNYRLYLADQLCSRFVCGLSNFRKVHKSLMEVVYILLLDNNVLPF